MLIGLGGPPKLNNRHLADGMSSKKTVVQKNSEKCAAKHARFKYNPSGVYCNATHDGYLCWPPTKAGRKAKQKCPSGRLIDSTKSAYRRCGPYGMWLGRNQTESSPGGWTNYTKCFPSRAQELLGRVDKEDIFPFMYKTAQTTRYLEIVGFSFSFVFVALSLYIFSRFRALRNNRTWIHKNLYCAMLLQVVPHLVLYTDQAVNRDEFGDQSRQDNETAHGIDTTPYLCEAIYILLEYGINVMFMWMFIEGLYLHNLVTANALRDKFSYRFYYILGWVVPVFITGIWAVMTALEYQKENVRTCWYGYNFSPLYWILQGPRLAIILINMVFLLNILRVIIVKLRETEDTELEKIRKAVRAALVLLPLLGITNILSMIEPPLDGSCWKFALWSYTTHFLRSFQGFFIALIYCFLNGEVRTVLRRHYHNYRAMRLNKRRRQRNRQTLYRITNRRRHPTDIPTPRIIVTSPNYRTDPIEELNEIPMRELKRIPNSSSKNAMSNTNVGSNNSLERYVNDEAGPSTSYADGLTTDSNVRTDDTENV